MTTAERQNATEALAENTAAIEALDAREAKAIEAGDTSAPFERIHEDRASLKRERVAILRRIEAAGSAVEAKRRVRLRQRVKERKETLAEHEEHHADSRQKIASAMVTLGAEFPKLNHAAGEHRAQLGALKRTLDELGDNRPNIAPLPRFRSADQFHQWIQVWEADLRRAGIEEVG